MDIEHEPFPIQKSYLQWHFESVGLPTLLLILSVSLLSLVLIVVLFLRGRGPGLPAAILFILPLPLVIGFVCLLGGSITYLNQLAAGGEKHVPFDALAYAVTSFMQATSCFLPLLVLSLALLMVLGFRNHQSKG